MRLPGTTLALLCLGAAGVAATEPAIIHNPHISAPQAAGPATASYEAPPVATSPPAAMTEVDAPAAEIAAAESTATNSTDAPAVIAWRQNLFAVPFRVNRAADAADAPVAVQLYVSADRGVTWSQAEQADPALGEFLYRAEGDGEYWFSIRTVDHNGQMHPQGPHRGDLRVRVDTQAPQLTLTARRGDDGRLAVSWEATDDDLDRGSIEVEVQSAASGEWQRLPLQLSDDSTTGSTWTGGAQWQTPAGNGPLTLRAHVSDRAGNRMVAQAGVTSQPPPLANVAALPTNLPVPQVVPPQPTAPQITPPQMAAPQFAAPQMTAPQVTAPQVTPTPLTPPQLAAPQMTAPQLELPGAPFPSAALPPATPPGSTSPWSSAAHGEVTPLALPPGTPPLVTPQAVTTTPAGAAQPWAADRLASRPLDAQAGVLPIPDPVAVPPAAPPTSPLAAPRTRPVESLPPGVEPLVIGSPRFSLQYDLESVGPSGVSRVELWGTRDGGKTWTSSGVDRDSQSPVRVQVDEAGLYGFRIVVTGADGAGGAAPQSGDSPDVWVMVDPSGG